ncbi:MAG: hypothetical protein GY938_22925, partial [Ketobacter sp.]|nr:hypothetical protein [Ketobacter sp.]
NSDTTPRPSRKVSFIDAPPNTNQDDFAPTNIDNNWPSIDAWNEDTNRRVMTINKDWDIRNLDKPLSEIQRTSDFQSNNNNQRQRNKNRHNKRDCNVRGSNNNNNYFSGNYILATDVAAHSYTNELDINAPVIVPFKVKDFKCKTNNGYYKGFIDTGANTPCIHTKYAIEQRFPIWKLRRNIIIDTGGGPIECQHATVLDILNKDQNGDEYWMRVIFYLLDNVPVEIIIDRATMRMLGLDVGRLIDSKYAHRPSATTAWTDEDDIFLEQLIDPDILVKVTDRDATISTDESSNTNSAYPDVIDIDRPNDNIKTNHKPNEKDTLEGFKNNDLLENRRTIEGDLDKIINYSKFDTTNSSTIKDPSESKVDALKLINNTFDVKNEFITEPLHANKSDQFARYRIVNKDDKNHVIGNVRINNRNDTNNTKYLHKKNPIDPIRLNSTLKTPNESIKPEINYIDVGLNNQRLHNLYTSSLNNKFISSTNYTESVLHERTDFQSYLAQFMPTPMDLDKPRSNELTKRHLFIVNELFDPDYYKDAKRTWKFAKNKNKSNSHSRAFMPNNNHCYVSQYMPADEIPEHFELFTAQSNIGSKIKQQLKELLAKYDDRMAKEWADCGLIPGVTLKLDLIPG